MSVPGNLLNWVCCKGLIKWNHTAVLLCGRAVWVHLYRPVNERVTWILGFQFWSVFLFVVVGYGGLRTTFETKD